MAHELCAQSPTRTVCEALRVSRSSLLRWRHSGLPGRSSNAASITDPTAQGAEPAASTSTITDKARRRNHRRLNEAERAAVLAILHSAAFVDKAPPQVYAILLDRGEYLCSISTMYRLLRENREVRERRDLIRHPVYTKPELLATAPREVFSWDITELRGPVKGSYFHLYVMIDIFSRFVVGWMLANRQNAKLAGRFISEVMRREGIAPGTTILHADRGGPMVAKTTMDLLDALGVEPSHSRPYVSDDNPFSEAHFKTFKYHPSFPERFYTPEEAEAFCGTFFNWYNTEHRHSGIALLTPAMVHYGQVNKVVDARATILANAYARNPERFVNGTPKPQKPPSSVWINQPPDTQAMSIHR
ncbi:MAG: IS3 family transposase [Vulcanimicrobiaceae bacterium]